MTQAELMALKSARNDLSSVIGCAMLSASLPVRDTKQMGTDGRHAV